MDSDQQQQQQQQPILDIFFSANSPPSIQRDYHFLVAHFGFFLFNLINVVLILFFVGCVLGRFRKNTLWITGLAACTMQLCSCFCSINRYRIGDEYGSWAHASNATGLTAYAFFNITVLRILRRTRYGGFGCCGGGCFGGGGGEQQRERIVFNTGCFFWIALAIATFVYGDLVAWERSHFRWIRLYFSISTVFQLVTYTLACCAFRRGGGGGGDKGLLPLPESFPYERDGARKALLFCCFAIAVALLGGASSKPVFQYPATGMTFSVMLIAVSVVGEIPFQKQQQQQQQQEEEDNNNNKNDDDGSGNNNNNTTPDEESGNNDNNKNVDGAYENDSLAV